MYEDEEGDPEVGRSVMLYGSETKCLGEDEMGILRN